MKCDWIVHVEVWLVRYTPGYIWGNTQRCDDSFRFCFLAVSWIYQLFTKGFIVFFDTLASLCSRFQTRWSPLYQGLSLKKTNQGSVCVSSVDEFLHAKFSVFILVNGGEYLLSEFLSIVVQSRSGRIHAKDRLKNGKMCWKALTYHWCPNISENVFIYTKVIVIWRALHVSQKMSFQERSLPGVWLWDGLPSDPPVQEQLGSEISKLWAPPFNPCYSYIIALVT